MEEAAYERQHNARYSLERWLGRQERRLVKPRYQRLFHAEKGYTSKTYSSIAHSIIWLANVSKTKGLAGGARIAARYRNFLKDLPRICRRLKRRREDLTFVDFFEIVEIWLKAAR
jgi:hypothetical protein